MSESGKTGEIVCQVCFHHCRLSQGQVGLCRARKNEQGCSISINYGKITSMGLDPIEKKPLARFYPGSKILSVESFGCNLDCPFCQNDAISCAGKESVPWEVLSPERLAAQADSLRSRGNLGVAFTYNEPLVGWEYVRDTAMEVRKREMKTVVVTNGSVSLQVLDEILPWTDAFNIDLKGFTAEWYRSLGGDLDTVLAFIRKAAPAAHVELTTLIVPGSNDSVKEIQNLAEWVASVDRTIPLHLTRFFPRRNRVDCAPTDIRLLYSLADAASPFLDTVLVGNV